MKRIQQMALEEAECLNNRDLDGVCKFYTDDVVYGDTSDPGNYISGKAGFREVTQALFDGFSDIKAVPLRFLFTEDDNVVAMEHVLTGTLDGTFAGIGPTGKKFEIKAVSVYELRGELFCREFLYWDMNSMMEQLK